MVDTAISDLAALTGANLATGDEFVVVDKSDTTMSADGTDKRMVASEAASGLARVGGYGTFFRKVRQTLTNKTSFAGATAEQWGSEEATLDDALLPALTSVTVEARVFGTVLDLSSNTTSVLVVVEISLDGGSTWSTGTNTHLRRQGDGVAGDRFPMAAAHSVTGTVTGDIQARAMATCSTGVGTAYDLIDGTLYMDVIRAAS